jgi:Outer membrane efflux protein
LSGSPVFRSPASETKAQGVQSPSPQLYQSAIDFLSELLLFSSPASETHIEGEMLDKARRVLASMEYSYRAGEASLVEFLDAQRAFNDTMQGYNEARAEYARGLYLIDSVTGKDAW